MKQHREIAEAVAALASFVSETTFASLPSEVVRQACLLTADTIGVALLGSTEDEVRALHRQLPAGGSATLLAAGFPRSDMEWASFANATAICFLELDEGGRPTGHPALHVLPVALACAQTARASGQDFLTALIVGYEVQARIQRAARLRWPVHPHGNLGNAAAVAALARIHGWGVDRTRSGLNAAARLAVATSWTPCLLGTTVRNAYPGVTALIAFAVRMLVDGGFSADDGALEETFGLILGSDFDISALDEALGERYFILENYFKFHAACALTHPVLDALAAAFRADRRIGEYPPFRIVLERSAASVREVRVSVSDRAHRLALPAEANQLSAKFSIPFAVATFLVRGETSPSSFRGPALVDPLTREVADRVRVEVSAEMSRRWPAEAAAEVQVLLEDGRVLTGRCANPFGAAANPATADDLRAKFHALTADVLTESVREEVWDRCLALESAADMLRFPAG